MVNYIMVSSAKSLMLLSIMSGKLFIYKRNRQGPCTEPCGTPDITGQVSDSSPSSTTRWVLFERKDPIQVITSLFMPKTMELQQEPFVIYLIKVSKVAKIRNRYNQAPRLTQDTNGKVTNSQKTLLMSITIMSV